MALMIDWKKLSQFGPNVMFEKVG